MKNQIEALLKQYGIHIQNKDDFKRLAYHLQPYNFSWGNSEPFIVDDAYDIAYPCALSYVKSSVYNMYYFVYYRSINRCDKEKKTNVTGLLDMLFNKSKQERYL